MFHEHLSRSAAFRFPDKADAAPACNQTSTTASRVTKIAVRTAAGETAAYVSTPETGLTNPRPLLTLHGITRDAKAVFEAFRSSATHANRVIITPEFTQDTWPVFQRIDHRHRPDTAILKLLYLLRASGTIGGQPVDVFGFSGGAQLAHRFAMLYPHLVSSLNLSSAGWYSLPSETIPFPYGLDPVGTRKTDSAWPRRMTQGLDAFLRLPVNIFVGALDTKTDEKALRRNPTLDAAQGQHRLARAQAYQAAFTDAALARGIEPAVRFRELAACGHDFAQCVEEGGLADLVSC